MEAIKNDVPDKKTSFQAKVNLNENDSLKACQALLREKIAELQEEIDIYQKENASLELIKKLKNEELKIIQKEKEQFERMHREQMSKLNAELEEKRQQIKKDKLSFQKHQKLKKDTADYKEKEEYTTLKRQLESLQEETKKTAAKYKLELKNLRSLLSTAQKDRDFLKNENECLTERLNEMLTIKMSQTPSLSNYKPKSKNGESNFRHLKSEFQPLKENVSLKSLNSGSSDSKKQIRFNLVPEVKTYSTRSSESINFENEESNGGKKLNYTEIDHGYKVERLYNNGDIEHIFKSGSEKYISADGLHVRTRYFNGDVEETFPDGRTIYTYADGITEIKLKDGPQIYEHNNQVEKQFPDGLKQITTSDNTVFIERENGIKETTLSNGNTLQLLKDGTVIILNTNGDKEIRGPDYMRHEYTDGTVKVVYNSGRSETHFPNGRVKIKNSEGNVIYDSEPC